MYGVWKPCYNSNVEVCSCKHCTVGFQAAILLQRVDACIVVTGCMQGSGDAFFLLA
jgi:hypothetical protein